MYYYIQLPVPLYPNNTFDILLLYGVLRFIPPYYHQLDATTLIWEYSRANPINYGVDIDSETIWRDTKNNDNNNLESSSPCHSPCLH